MFAIVEPRISGAAADAFIRRTGYDFSYRVEANGLSGGIWVMWRDKMQFDVLAVSNQFFHGWCRDLDSNVSFFLTFVYASPNQRGRRLLWDQLCALEMDSDAPWVLGGDFNAIYYADDRQGGSQCRMGVCRLFGDFMFESGLYDMGFNGPRFTWKRGDLQQRLDRWICSGAWYCAFPLSEVFHLQRLGSDHRPILLATDRLQRNQGARPFRFIAAWNEHPEFAPLLSESWKMEKGIFENLTDFQNCSRRWNREVFGHIGQRKNQLLARIRGVEIAIERNQTPFLLDLERSLKVELFEVLKQEESLWFQKSRSQWIEQGDRNTKYFHAKTLSRRRKNSIKMLRLDNGAWCDDPKVLQEHAVDFFSSLFTSEPCPEPPELVLMGFPQIHRDAMQGLLREVTLDEVTEVVFSMSPLKAPGADGFHATFFQKNWSTVGESVFRFVSDFFEHGHLLDDANQTLLVLIPKVQNPTKISQYRPISLCIVLYKVITKILVNRLKPLLSDLVSQNQVSFVPGRQITDNIILAQEIVHSMAKKNGAKAWMAVKVDLEKAYDRLE
ncbi:hypothetical protein HRI_002379900 [Hibiscus trionum]|uniref:Reverse transcriptase domain-containing protein n=1 Tax=Hibiscus trionum TaxID=183268 RepID=A0A9W7I195_HIBTR|nr:hypothetical protein HRI_002379900 [Hibiscus trionum]